MTGLNPVAPVGISGTEHGRQGKTATRAPPVNTQPCRHPPSTCQPSPSRTPPPTLKTPMRISYIETRSESRPEQTRSNSTSIDQIQLSPVCIGQTQYKTSICKALIPFSPFRISLQPMSLVPLYKPPAHVTCAWFNPSVRTHSRPPTPGPTRPAPWHR